MLKFDREKLFEKPWVPFSVIITSGLISTGIMPKSYSTISMGTFITSSILLIVREYKLWLIFSGLDSDRKLYQNLMRVVPYKEFKETHGMGRIFRKDFIHFLGEVETFLELPTNFFINKKLNRLKNYFLNNLKAYYNLLEFKIFPLNEDNYTLGEYSTYPEGHEALTSLVNDISQQGYKLRNSYAKLLTECKAKLRI